MLIKKKYTAAVIGCGTIGASSEIYNKAVRPGTHADAYFENKRIKLVGLADRTSKKFGLLKKKFPGVHLYQNAETMLVTEHPEIVSVAVPTALHHDMVLLAAKHGARVILCEKPISYSTKEAGEMIRECKKRNTVLLINHQRHFDPLLLKWGTRIRNGYLGHLFQVNVYYYNGLFNSATHLIDLLLLFLGDPVSVIAKYNTKTSSNAHDPNVDGLIYFKDGVTVSLQSLNKNYGDDGFSIFADKGWLNISNLMFEVQFRKKIKNKFFKGYYGLSDKILKEGKMRSLMISAIDATVGILDKKTKPYGTGEDGLKVLKILQSIKRSADANGKEFQINLKI